MLGLIVLNNYDKNPDVEVEELVVECKRELL